MAFFNKYVFVRLSDESDDVVGQMDDIGPIYREIHELNACIAEKHVQAWRHRMAGDRTSMKSVHANIKACKKRIADCHWMIGILYRSISYRRAPISSGVEISLIVTFLCCFAFAVWILMVTSTFIRCCFRCNK
jgi:hypothetical protein